MRIAFFALALSFAARAEDLVRLGNLKFAHYGAVSHMKEVCPKYGVRLEERMFAKGLDIVPGILAGEIDLAASALDAAIAGRAAGAPVFVVAGFAKGGSRILARKGAGIAKIEDLKGRKVGTARGGAQELLLYAPRGAHLPPLEILDLRDAPRGAERRSCCSTPSWTSTASPSK